MTNSRSDCSVVLEGGVTSAVVYATLLASLARAFSFRQLGGASSGAVGAAAAAAAEYARGHTGRDAAFRGLARFPGELMVLDHEGRTALFRFFQARPDGRDSLSLVLELLPQVNGQGGRLRFALRVVLALVRHFRTSAFLLGLVLLGLGVLCVRSWANGVCAKPLMIDHLVGCLVAGTGFLLLSALGAVAILAGWALYRTFRALRENHWGLCNGMPTHAWTASAALTPVLHDLLQRLSGRPPVETGCACSGPARPSAAEASASAPLPAAGATATAAAATRPPTGPLTFGDLWRWPAQLPRPDDEPDDSRWIDLQVVTSAVNLARPVRLPGKPGDDPLREFFYDPVEWQALFPCDVLAHLKAHARPVTAEIPRNGTDPARPLLALPPPAQWPVLMAIRFSLSFPILLSALPMYIALPEKKALARGDPKGFEYRKVYFSDGGITSNCPVHLFDAPLTRFPTFGVNLYAPPIKEAQGASSLGRPAARATKGIVRSDRLDPEVSDAATTDAAGWEGPLPFIMAIVTTMMDWRDSLARRQPGSRERMIHVEVPKNAGGLNLGMSPATIKMLARRGVRAALRLKRDFDLDAQRRPDGAWMRHRWVRTRTTLAALRQYLDVFAHRLGTGDPDYLRLLQAFSPTEGGFPTQVARQQALDLARGAAALMSALDRTVPPDALAANGPEPAPELHLSPPW